MKKLFYFFLPLLAFVACTDNGTDNNTNNNQGGGNQPVQNELTATPANLSFDSEEDSQTIDVYSTASWTAEFVNDRAKDWCSISPTNGNAGNSSILVSVKENTTGEERSASIVVKSESLQKIVKVAQKQNDALTVTSSKFEVKAEGGEVEIEVKANIDYDYTIEESAKSWVKYKTTRAMETSTLVFDISENTSIDKREAKITFKSGNLKEVVTIYQDGTDYAIIISKDEYAVSDKGETITVEVKSNVDVVVEIPSDVDWVKESSSRAMSTNTYYFEISPNEDYNSRSTTIKFTNKENNLSESISITQAQKDAIVIAKDSYSLNDEGGNIDIEVGHNVDFDIEISDNWITQTTTRAFETETLRFNITANTSEDSRDGTIKFISKDKSITQTVKVYQAQKDALIVSKKDITIDEQQQTVEFEVRANVEYTVSDPSASWLHREETRAMTSQTIRYTVDVNTSYDSRTATITVQSKDGSLKETISITQAQKDAIVLAKSSYNLENEGGNIDIEVGHNVDFDIEISDNWITQTTTRAFETETLTFNITANTSEDSREGTIKFISKNNTITQTVTISQNGEPVRIITFADQYAKKVCVEKYDTNGDGELSEREAATVTSIKGNFFGDYKEYVVSFDEFKYFTSVKELGWTFENCTNLKTITLPNSITSIGTQTFNNCTALQNINIPNTVTTIGLNAFRGCENLESITIPDSVKSLGRNIFQDCIKIKNVIIGNGVTSIQSGSFTNCRSLESITIGKSVKSIDCRFNSTLHLKYVNIVDIGSWCNIDFSTYECHPLCFDRSQLYLNGDLVTNITIPDSVTTIRDYAFYSCSSLTSITIPDSVTTIGRSAFNGCSSLTSVTIPDSVTMIGQSAFYSCSSLTSITIPDSVPEIGQSAFSGCSSLTSITIPDSVILIGEKAFFGCTSLKSVTIPNSVVNIGMSAFGNCTNLSAFYGKFATEDNTALVNGEILMQYAIGCKATSYTIPNTVTEIAKSAFSGCSSLTTITIPDSVTTIGNSAFSGCSSLTSVYIPDGVTTIGSGAFLDCSSLTTITIPDSVTEIESYVFYGCSSLTSITIPDSVTDIGDGAFLECSNLTSVVISQNMKKIQYQAFKACIKLAKIYCKAMTPPTFYAEVFAYLPSTLCVYIPIGSLDAYKNSSWSRMNLKEYNFDE